MNQQRPLLTNLSYCKVDFLGSTCSISLILDCFNNSNLMFNSYGYEYKYTWIDYEHTKIPHQQGSSYTFYISHFF
jgi:hypothetical protein